MGVTHHTRFAYRKELPQKSSEPRGHIAWTADRLHVTDLVSTLHLLKTSAYAFSFVVGCVSSKWVIYCSRAMNAPETWQEAVAPFRPKGPHSTASQEFTGIFPFNELSIPFAIEGVRSAFGVTGVPGDIAQRLDTAAVLHSNALKKLKKFVHDAMPDRQLAHLDMFMDRRGLFEEGQAELLELLLSMPMAARDTTLTVAFAKQNKVIRGVILVVRFV